MLIFILFSIFEIFVKIFFLDFFGFFLVIFFSDFWVFFRNFFSCEAHSSLHKRNFKILIVETPLTFWRKVDWHMFQEARANILFCRSCDGNSGQFFSSQYMGFTKKKRLLYGIFGKFIFLEIFWIACKKVTFET